jgi:hypothetical protein
MNFMEKTEIRTIEDLLDIVRDINGEERAERDVAPPIVWFRGHAVSDWELVPSIQRVDDFEKKEAHISNAFYSRVKPITNDTPEKNNVAGWMSLMQHYGLPTRLLDWSASPLISVFFATEKYREYEASDACVWVFRPRRLNEKEGFGEHIYPVDSRTVHAMLEPGIRPKRQADPDLKEKVGDKIIACASVEHNMRMYLQQSAFTVHNSLKKLTGIMGCEELFKIIIPRGRKEYFSESLALLGIRESFVYPEIEHITNAVKRIYGI